MKMFIVLLATIAVALGGLVEVDDRIIGGKETTIEEYPYQISLRYGGRHNCGGSIVNANTIITAGHCVHGFNYDLITVKVGATIHHEGEEFKPSHIIKHPMYNIGAQFNYDIAIIKLETPLTFSDRVQPIALQPAGIKVSDGTIAFVSGWGTIQAGVQMTPEELRVVDVNTLTNQQCKENYGNSKITSVMMCAKAPGHDSCQGDSGGPLAANGKLIGVVSWGYGCADAKYPGVYADVSSLHEFIDQYL